MKCFNVRFSQCNAYNFFDLKMISVDNAFCDLLPNEIIKIYYIKVFKYLYINTNIFTYLYN